MLDELPLGQRHHHLGELEHAGEIRRGDGEVAADLVGAQAEVEAGALLDRPEGPRDGIDDHRGVGALEPAARRGQRGAQAGASGGGVDPRGGVEPRQLPGEIVLYGVHYHLAVVVRQDVVPLGAEPGLEVVAVGDVAVVGAVDVGLAAHHMRLRVGVGDRAEGGPAHLPAEDLPGHVDDPQPVHHHRGGADALDQRDLLALPLDRRAGGVIAAVLQGLE